MALAGGNPTLYGYVSDSNTWVDESGLYGVKHDTPAWNARKNQQSSGYGKDNCRTGSLKKGEIVYGGVPGPSSYYMDKKTLDVSDGSREKLWKSLQVKPNPEKGYRPKVQIYRVKREIKVEKGYALANPEYGKGGGRQFFIENYSEVLEPIGEPINLESDKNVILCK